MCGVFADIDECSSDPSPCDENADCTNSDGSYSCTCKQGFAGNGTVCNGMRELSVSLHFFFFMSQSNGIILKRMN